MSWTFNIRDLNFEFEGKIDHKKNLEHRKATDLTLVGLQVWRGALLLADYIFHNRVEFKDKRVLELGSGVGLTGMNV